ncbi:LysR family transcriptional regulator [Mesorhizobium sp. LNHC229A00]|uniref:LysR family transcriptional regulator n=1 Tax=Mesorhizobium sp. LNHC229A00 TaxID=1287240 RepID=UPI000422ABB2|nr:LysR family transcriptional regulator [Mesorhizobium sp. LNHC229A00]
MDLKKLRYFVGVAEAGGFTRAGEQMNVAQSALSLHVREMEDSLGTRLLVRDRGGVTLTAAGSRLLHHARIILNQVSIAEEELTSNPKTPVGEVSVALPSGPARFMAPELLNMANERFPKVSLKIVEGMSGSVEEMMLAGRFNLAVFYTMGDDNSRYDILAEEEFCLIIPPDSPPFENVVSLDQLSAYPLAVPMNVTSVQRAVADVAKKNGILLDVRYEIDSLSTIIDMVADGKAYSILTPSAVQRETSLGLIRTAKIINPSISRSVILAANARDERSAEVAAIRGLLPKVVRQLIKDGRWQARLPQPERLRPG